MILALGLVALRGKTICLDKPVIKFAKVIGHIENLSNFVSCNLYPGHIGYTITMPIAAL